MLKRKRLKLRIETLKMQNEQQERDYKNLKAIKDKLEEENKTLKFQLDVLQRLVNQQQEELNKKSKK